MRGASDASSDICRLPLNVSRIRSSRSDVLNSSRENLTTKMEFVCYIICKFFDGRWVFFLGNILYTTRSTVTPSAYWRLAPTGRSTWSVLCRCCLQTRWSVCGGNLSSLEGFPRSSCTDVAVRSLFWRSYFFFFSCVLYQSQRDLPRAVPSSLPIISIQLKVSWQPPRVGDCFFSLCICHFDPWVVAESLAAVFVCTRVWWFILELLMLFSCYVLGSLSHSNSNLILKQRFPWTLIEILYW